MIRTRAAPPSGVMKQEPGTRNTSLDIGIQALAEMSGRTSPLATAVMVGAPTAATATLSNG